MDRLISAVALVDLDDTLFQTRRKCPPGEERLTALGFAADGSPLGFATPRQMRFLEWLSATCHVVPVTARSLDAFRRVRLPIGAAVCAHGGVILGPDGEVDQAWAREIAAAAAGRREELEGLAAAVVREAARRGADVRTRVLTEGGVPLYVLAKHATPEGEDELHAVVDVAAADLPPGWTDHRNGNNAALLPPHLGKARAVARLLPGLRERFPDAPVLGIGDSVTDAPFMALCDYAALPTRSQLARRLFDGG